MTCASISFTLLFMSNNETVIDLPEIPLESLNVEEAVGWLSTVQDRAIEITITNHGWAIALVLFTALVAGWLVRKMLLPKIETVINRLSIPYRLNRILKNIAKLQLQLVALIVVGGGEVVLQTVFPDLDRTFLTAAAKLLVAWIFIRMIAQIVENTALRQSVATFAWAIAALSILGVLDETTQALDAFGINMGDNRISALSVLKTAIAVGILLTLAGIVTRISERKIHNSASLTPSAQVLISKIIKITLVSLAILIGITSAGINLSALAVFGGALALGVGFGLQKVISNLFSGMLLLIDKSIKPGDILEIPNSGGVFGWVGQLGARYVSVVTRDNKEYLIPNEDFITQTVINWSFTNRLIRVETGFGVHYQSDPHEVKRLVEEAVASVDRVVSDPAPVCHLVEFGDSSLNFVLRYWIEDAEKGVTNTKGAVMLKVWMRLRITALISPIRTARFLSMMQKKGDKFIYLL